jgi:hypothetical protein
MKTSNLIIICIFFIAILSGCATGKNVNLSYQETINKVRNYEARCIKKEQEIIKNKKYVFSLIYSRTKLTSYISTITVVYVEDSKTNISISTTVDDFLTLKDILGLRDRKEEKKLLETISDKLENDAN